MKNLGYWVKPQSTTWFSKFLLEEYDDDRWVQMFRMTKRAVLSLAELLAPLICRRDTNYRLAIPVTVHVACTLFKHGHGASLLICSELFAVGRSTVSIMLRDVVHAVNVGLRNELMWPTGDDVSEVAAGFQSICGLPGIAGAIDGTHFAISKPQVGASDYFYFKSRAYSMTCQAIVDSRKRFLDLNVGMPGSTNDSGVLRRSTLYHCGQRGTLWDAGLSFDGFTPFLIGDSGYPLLPWLMTPHRLQGHLAPAASLFNRRLSKGRVAVENAFALLKQSFRELHTKTDLHVTFVPDVVLCCSILHNTLIKESHEDEERLLRLLQVEAQERGLPAISGDALDKGPAAPDHVEGEDAQLKRLELGLWLSTQTVNPV